MTEAPIIISIIAVIIALVLGLVPERSRFLLEKMVRLIFRRPIISVWVRREEEEIEYLYAGGRVAWHGIVVKNDMRLNAIDSCYVKIAQATMSELGYEKRGLGRYDILHWAKCYIPHRHEEVQHAVSKTGRQILLTRSPIDFMEIVRHYQDQHIVFTRLPECFPTLGPGEAEKLDILAVIEFFARATKQSGIRRGASVSLVTYEFPQVLLPRSGNLIELEIWRKGKLLKRVRVKLDQWKSFEDVRLRIVE